MATWLEAGGHELPLSLRFLVDHLCRDDYGVPASAVSARAGLAALTAHDPDDPGLSWPAGTGWVARRLAGRLGERLHTRAGASAVVRDGTGVRVTTPATVYRCDAVVWAAPISAAAGVVEGTPELGVEHAPWIVANLTLERAPRSKGAPEAWHNLRMGSPSTGYVPADHQTLRTATPRTVWTWYRPLDDVPPAGARARLRTRRWSAWVQEILADLEAAHPDIRECVSRVDVRRLPRGTPIPAPGVLDDPARTAFREAEGPVVFAHSELGALPRVGHAVREGVRAARRVLGHLRVG